MVIGYVHLNYSSLSPIRVKALKAIVKLKPILTTIHISGGDEMQKTSAKIKKNKTKILGVTILTSLNSSQTKKYYNNQNVNQLVK